jgi:hypothetical protein
MRTAPVWSLALCVLFGGCGSQGLVTVSGIVTMDDKPLTGASVIFQPINAAGGADAAWGEAYGKTDSGGRYSLYQVLNDKPGAGPGKYRVTIVSGTAPIPDPLSDALPPPGTIEPIPARYNSQSELSFDVPAGGTEKADFQLKSKPAAN